MLRILGVRPNPALIFIIGLAVVGVGVARRAPGVMALGVVLSLTATGRALAIWRRDRTSQGLTDVDRLR